MGLSKVKTAQSLSRYTAIPGSPSYMAPECLLQKKQASNNSIWCMVTGMYVIWTIYRTRLLGRFVERKEACIGRELWRFFSWYQFFDGCHGEEKISSCVGIAFRNFFATHSYRLLWVWQCPEASRHWHCHCSTTVVISREVACKGFVFPFFNRRSTTSWYCNEWTSFRFVNLKKCTISNYLQVLSICDVFR